jgi:hypothetical protein
MEWKNLFEQIQLIKVKSVIDPLLKVGLFILTSAAFTNVLRPDSWISIALFVLACIFLFAALFFYYYFAMTDPSLLRSEEHEIRKRALEMLGDNDKKFNPADIMLIAKPLELQQPENQQDKKEG